jgi:hypothetical protein
MYPYSKWWLVLELFVGAMIVDAAGYSNLAIVVAIGAIVALFVALELDGDRDDDEHGLTIERLALVLAYARQYQNVTGEPAGSTWLDYCRRRALGLDRW